MGIGHTAGGYWSYGLCVLVILLGGTGNTAGTGHTAGVLVILLVGTDHTAGGTGHMAGEYWLYCW